MFLARKISRAKWDPKDDLADGEIAADAVTADLRTNGNRLSLWRCGDGTPEESDDVVRALTASYDQVGVCDVAWIAAEELTAVGQVWEKSDGLTPVDDLVQQHVDLVRLDYDRLGRIARFISASGADGRCRRTRVPEVLDLLATAVEDGRLPVDALRYKVPPRVDERLALREAGAASPPD